MTELVEESCKIIENSCKEQQYEKKEVVVDRENKELVLAIGEKSIEEIETPKENVVEGGETVEFVLVYQNNRFQIKFELDNTILKLKDHVLSLTGRKLFCDFSQIFLN